MFVLGRGDIHGKSEKLNAPVAMMKKDIELIENNLLQPLHARGFAGKVLRFFSVHLMKQTMKKDTLKKFTPDVLLKDGMRLHPFGIDGKVIALPGHTKGSLGILLDSKDLFVGDALMNMLFPGLPLIYNGEKEMKNSAAKIGSIRDAVIYFGHGKPTKNRKWI